MKKSTFERILKVTVILTLLGIGILQFLEINLFSEQGVSKVSTILSGVLLFWIFFISTGWKWPLIKYIAYQKNINGTWFGKYQSKDFTTDKIYTGDIAVIIRQSFLRINVKSFTKIYINYSFAEAFIYNSVSDSNQLIYLYSQSEFKPTHDNVRKGTSELMLHSKLSSEELFGDFWTNHNSKGTLTLKKISSKHAKSFSEAKEYLK